MKTTLFDLREGLPDEIRDVWLSLQQSNPDLTSPYFSPFFTNIISSAGRPIELALLEDGNNITGIYPFERRYRSLAGPVGDFISDYQGLICAPNYIFDPREILLSSRLKALDFNHLIQSQVGFTPFHRERNRVPIIDLGAGYEEYVKGRNAAGTVQVKKNSNLRRRIEREVGPLRFIAHSVDKELLETVFKWKTNQFRRNRWRDIFSIPWVRRSMIDIHETQNETFSGMLSAIYAGDKLIAAHFGMRSATVWHYWFPTYDPTYAKYSPGVMLLLNMAESASSIGIKTIDLGSGEHSYKWRLMNGFIPTARGSVELLSPLTVARRMWIPAENMLCKTRHLIGKTLIGDWSRHLRNCN